MRVFTVLMSLGLLVLQPGCPSPTDTSDTQTPGDTGVPDDTEVPGDTDSDEPDTSVADTSDDDTGDTDGGTDTAPEDTDEPIALTPLRIRSFPSLTASSDATWRYRVTINRPTLPVFTLVEAPTGAAISENGNLTWRPDVSESTGKHRFEVEARVGQEAIRQVFHVHVARVTRAVAQEVLPDEEATMAIAAPLSPIRGTSVTVPRGALVTERELEIGTVESPPPLPAAQVADDAADDEVTVVSFGPSGTVFARDVTLTLPLAPSAVARADGDPERVEVWTLDGAVGTWERLPVQQVDLDAREVVVRTKHFSQFATFSGVPLLQPLEPTHGGAQCPDAVVVPARLDVPFATLRTEWLNGNDPDLHPDLLGDAMAALAPGDAVKLVYRGEVTLEAGDADERFLVVDATRRADALFDLRVTDRSGTLMFAESALDHASPVLEAFLGGEALHLLFNRIQAPQTDGLGSLRVRAYGYFTSVHEAPGAPPSLGAHFAEETLSFTGPLAASTTDADCDRVLDPWDPTPTGIAPPTVDPVGSARPRTVTGQAVTMEVVVSSQDPAGHALTFSTSGDGALVIDGARVTFTSDTPGTHPVHARATDGGGEGGFTFEVSVEVPEVNTPPECAITASKVTLLEGDTTALEATGIDPEQSADAITYQWTATEPGALSSTQGARVIYTPTTAGDHLIRCVAHDGIEAGPPSELALAVLEPSVNNAPELEAVSPVDRTYESLDPVTLSLFASGVDLDGDALSFEVVAVEGSPTVSALASDARSASWSVTLPDPGVYRLDVRAFDGELHSAARRVTLRVYAPVEPGAVDADGDGWPSDLDCDDADPAVHPGQAERCDGKDTSCSGVVDDLPDRSFYNGPALTQGIGACQAGVLTCDDGGWVVLTPETTPAAEACSGVDESCDGRVDEGCEAGGQCDVALPLHSAGETRVGSLANATNDVPATCFPDFDLGTGWDRVFTLVLDHAAVVGLQVGAEGAPVGASLVSDCPTGDVIACVGHGASHQELLDPGAYYIVLDTLEPSGLDFELSVTVDHDAVPPCHGVTCEGTLTCAPETGACVECLSAQDCDQGDVCAAGTCVSSEAGATCEAPMPLTPGEVVVSLVGATDDVASACAAPASPDRTYGLSLGERSLVSLTLYDEGDVDVDDDPIDGDTASPDTASPDTDPPDTGHPGAPGHGLSLTLFAESSAGAPCDPAEAVTCDASNFIAFLDPGDYVVVVDHVDGAGTGEATLGYFTQPCALPTCDVGACGTVTNTCGESIACGGCGDDDVCVDNVCMALECETALDCGEGEACDAGFCKSHGATCGAPIAIDPSRPVTDTMATATSTEVPSGCGRVGPYRVYALPLAEPTTVSVAFSAPSHIALAYYMDDCGDADPMGMSCMGSTVSIPATTLPAGTHYFVVESTQPAGEYTLDIRVGACASATCPGQHCEPENGHCVDCLDASDCGGDDSCVEGSCVDLALGDTCDSPAPLQAGVVALDLHLASDGVEGCGPEGSVDRVFTLDVAERSLLSIQVDEDQGEGGSDYDDLAMWLLDGDCAGPSLECASASLNAFLDPGTYTLVVEWGTPSPPDDLELVVYLSDCPEPTCGDGACGTVQGCGGSIECGDCGDGEVCAANTCQIATCGADAPCGDREICVDGSCASIDGWPGGDDCENPLWVMQDGTFHGNLAGASTSAGEPCGPRGPTHNYALELQEFGLVEIDLVADANTAFTLYEADSPSGLCDHAELMIHCVPGAQSFAEVLPPGVYVMTVQGHGGSDLYSLQVSTTLLGPVHPCDGVTCDPEYPCDPLTGACEEPPCDPASCDALGCGEHADDGCGDPLSCDPCDPCEGVTCEAGAICEPTTGACVPDGGTPDEVFDCANPIVLEVFDGPVSHDGSLDGDLADLGDSCVPEGAGNVHLLSLPGDAEVSVWLAMADPSMYFEVHPLGCASGEALCFDGSDYHESFLPAGDHYLYVGAAAADAQGAYTLVAGVSAIQRCDFITCEEGLVCNPWSETCEAPCEPLTCEDQEIECGLLWDDGCDTFRDCGGCDGEEECFSGTCRVRGCDEGGACPTTGDDCAEAIALTPGFFLVDTTTATDAVPSACDEPAGADRVFTLTLAERARVSLSLTSDDVDPDDEPDTGHPPPPTTSHGLTLSLLDDHCTGGAHTCGATSFLDILEAGTYTVVVDQTDAAGTGRSELSVYTTPCPPPTCDVDSCGVVHSVCGESTDCGGCGTDAGCFENVCVPFDCDVDDDCSGDAWCDEGFCRAPLAAGATCADPFLVEDNVPIMGTMEGATDDHPNACGGGPERVYLLALDETSDVTIHFWGDGASLSFYGGPDCGSGDSGACLAGAPFPLTASSMPPGDYYFVVESASAAATYTLQIDAMVVGDPCGPEGCPPDGTCATHDDCFAGEQCHSGVCVDSACNVQGVATIGATASMNTMLWPDVRHIAPSTCWLEEPEIGGVAVYAVWTEHDALLSLILGQADERYGVSVLPGACEREAPLTCLTPFDEDEIALSPGLHYVVIDGLTAHETETDVLASLCRMCPSDGSLCGPLDDGCGNTLDCGPCEPPDPDTSDPDTAVPDGP